MTLSDSTIATHNSNTIVDTSSKIPIGRLPTQSTLSSTSSYVPTGAAVYSAINNCLDTTYVLLAEITSTGNVNLNYSVHNYNGIIIYSYYNSLVKCPWFIPSAFITLKSGISLLFESWDGSRYRITLTSATANVTAEYYGLPIYIYGIK